MLLIAASTNDEALAKTATRQVKAAYETLRGGGDEFWAEYFQRELSKAQAIHDRLKAE
jgi:hypothetical protein